MSETYNLNLNAIINSHSAWALNKQLATKLSIAGNFTVESFFNTLSDDDLKFLADAIANTDYNDHAAAELFLMMMLLSMGEGLDIEDDDSLNKRFDALLAFITLESLARKGLVELRRENMSFGDDMAQEDLVKISDEGLKFVSDVLNDEDPK
jgi:hypothetical protein